MATQYTTILKLGLPVQGELDGTWGDEVNNKITSMVEEAVAGRKVINSWTTNSHTLTEANGATAEARAAILTIDDDGAGNPSGAATVICPALSKLYVVQNICGQAVTLKTSSGTGISVPNGLNALLFCDGTNVVAAGFNSLQSLLASSNTTSGTDIAVSTGDDITFADSSKAIFGAGSDLQVYHDGSNSYVKESGTGNLILDGSTINFQHGSTTVMSTIASGVQLTADDDKIMFGTGYAPEIRRGTGTPENNVSAAPGSIFMRTDTGKLYVKNTGISTTGWQLVTSAAE